MFKNLLIKNLVFIKFVTAGSLVTVIDLVFLYFLYEIFNIHLAHSVFFSYIFAFFISFLLQKYWTFSADKNNTNSTHKQLFMYFFISIINVFLNSLFVQLLVEYQRLILNDYLFKILVRDYNIWYLIAQAIICGTIGIESFLVYKYIIFKKCDIINNVKDKDI